MSGRVVIVCQANEGGKLKCRRVLAEATGATNLRVRPGVNWNMSAAPGSDLNIECPSHGWDRVSAIDLEAAVARARTRSGREEIRLLPHRIRPPRVEDGAASLPSDTL